MYWGWHNYSMRNYTQKGFTLIELIVVASIMSAIILLVTFNSRRFNDDLALQTAASEVSLAMRQAQSFGVSIKQTQSGSTDFNKPYGIAFDLQTPTNFFIYSDTNGDRKYDGAVACTGADECREKSILRGGVSVRRVCAAYMNDTITCFSGAARYLVLTYVRPNPEPVIKVHDTNKAEISGPWKTAYIELVNQRGTLMYVLTDYLSGQIMIQSTPVIP